MNPEQELKEFLETPVTQKNVIIMMGEAVDLIEDLNGPFEIDKLEVLMHAINDGKLIPGDDQGITGLTVISSGKFWRKDAEPVDSGGIDRWLKCVIDHDYLEIFTMFGTTGWITKYIKYALKYGTIRWLYYFITCSNFGQAFVEIISTEPELAIKLIDSWKLVLIPDILKKNESSGISIYQHMLNNPVFHHYMIENFPEYSSTFSKKQIMTDIVHTLGETFMESVISENFSQKNLQKKCKDQIDF